ncbi:MAG: FAD binding domain-containing protein [Anaerolineae bacterium]|nr:FAD binding domain-containing protein [Anaerolineae bacterium]
MLLNLKTLHKPKSVKEAAALLAQPGTYPLYNGVALQRSSSPHVLAAVQLDDLKLDYAIDSDTSLRLGTMLTLEQARAACEERAEAHPRLGAVATMLAQEVPQTLRNTMALGDLLMERDPQSPTLTLFLALGAVIKRLDVVMHLTMPAWFSTPGDVRRHLIGQVRITRGPREAAVAYEKVARTPADAPIVGAVASVECQPESNALHTTLAMCGIASTPIPQPDTARVFDETRDIYAALDYLVLDPPGDHWGSRDYRLEMARVVARRAVIRAWEQAQAYRS